MGWRPRGACAGDAAHDGIVVGANSNSSSGFGSGGGGGGSGSLRGRQLRVNFRLGGSLLLVLQLAHVARDLTRAGGGGVNARPDGAA